MINISLLEKIKQFFGILGNSNNSLIVILILLVISLFVLISCRMNDKMMKVFYVLLYISVLGIIMYVYHEQVLSLIDYLIENIIANLLFPNLAIYIGVLLFINIVVIISLFSKNVKLYVKNINIIFFAITQLFLYLIIENVIINSVNVYEKLSIYTNQNLLILVELSMQLFVVWIFVLGIIRLVDYFMDKYGNQVIEKEFDINENDLIKEEDYNVIEDVIDYETDSNENINYYENDYLVDNNKEEYKLINELNSINYDLKLDDDVEDYYKDYNSDNNFNELIEYVPLKKKKENAR